MTLKAISIDDEPKAHSVIQHYAGKIEKLNVMASFTSPLKALDFLADNEVDLIFLDINMPDLDGMSLLQTLKHPPAIIFTTAYDEYAVESYEHEAFGYLLKPVEFPKFYKAVMRVFDHKRSLSQPQQSLAERGETSVLFLRSGSKMLKFDVSEILFCEASGNYAEIHTKSDKKIVDHTLNDLKETFLPSQFCRVHRSYIVNKDHLTQYESHQITIGNQAIPIGKTYRKQVKEIILDQK